MKTFVPHEHNHLLFVFGVKQIFLSRLNRPPWLTSDAMPLVNSVICVALITGIVVILTRCAFKPQDNKAPVTRGQNISPPELPLSVAQIIHSFFTAPFDFISEGFKVTGSNTFRFRLRNNEVIAVSGDEARRTFFGAKDLNLYAGFQVLIGTVRNSTSHLTQSNFTILSSSLTSFSLSVDTCRSQSSGPSWYIQAIKWSSATRQPPKLYVMIS